jgi:hypothetical protein
MAAFIKRDKKTQTGELSFSRGGSSQYVPRREQKPSLFPCISHKRACVIFKCAYFVISLADGDRMQGWRETARVSEVFWMVIAALHCCMSPPN